MDEQNNRPVLAEYIVWLDEEDGLYWWCFEITDAITYMGSAETEQQAKHNAEQVIAAHYGGLQ